MKILPLVMLGLFLISIFISKRGYRFGKTSTARHPGHALPQMQPLDASPENLHHPDWRIRKAAVQALATTDPMRAIPHLANALSDTDVDVRQSAREVLERFGGLVIPELLSKLSSGDLPAREQTATALGHIGDPAGVSGLLSALHDESAWVRRIAAESLGKIGEPSAVPGLRESLQDEDGDVRTYAAAALERMGTAEARTALHPRVPPTASPEIDGPQELTG
jgi:HEAT repeat protein